MEPGPVLFATKGPETLKSEAFCMSACFVYEVFGLNLTFEYHLP